MTEASIDHLGALANRDMLLMSNEILYSLFLSKTQGTTAQP
jgi:hypothetical protein